MSIALLNSVLLRILSDPNYVAKGSALTWVEEDTNFKIICDILRDLSSVSDTSGFSPYDNGTTYSSSPADYVSYGGNIYRYINPIAQDGTTPGTDPLTWEIVSQGEFAHIQNTDQYLDLGGPYQVSAQDIYNLLTTPPGDALTQGTNTLTEDLTFLLGPYTYYIYTGDGGTNPLSSLQVTNGAAQLLSTSASGKITSVTTGSTNASLLYNDPGDSNKNATVSASDSLITLEAETISATGNLVLDNDVAYYIGQPGSNGSWRRRIDPGTGDLIDEVRIAGSWEERGRLSP